MRKVGWKLGIVVALVAGCGGGSSGFKPGVPGSKPVGMLSADEAKTLCRNTAAHLQMELTSSSGRESTCRGAGAAFASLSATDMTSDLQLQFACTAGYTLCQQALADGGTLPTVGGGDGGADPCDGPAANDPTCTATIDQYTACINEIEGALKTAYPQCAQLTKAKLTELTSAPGGILGAGTNGPACTAFTAACPGFQIPTGLPTGI
jgi:hypothetical protein